MRLESALRSRNSKWRMLVKPSIDGRLAELADANRAKERQIRLFTPHVHEARTTGDREVEFDAVAREFGRRTQRLQTRAAKTDAVLECRPARRGCRQSG